MKLLIKKRNKEKIEIEVVGDGDCGFFQSVNSAFRFPLLFLLCRLLTKERALRRERTLSGYFF